MSTRTTTITKPLSGELKNEGEKLEKILQQWGESIRPEMTSWASQPELIACGTIEPIKLSLRLSLIRANTVVFQNDVYEWAQDHRTHHKFSKTHADPHNSRRGFFFSHVGWLLVRKHKNWTCLT